MNYLVIDTDGSLLPRSRQGRKLDLINQEVGVDGFALVRFRDSPDYHLRLAGFVNDSGFLRDLPRNVVGSCLLACLGASPQPYAGPIVITGWNDRPRGNDVEACDINEEEADAILQLHTSIRRALDLTSGPDFHPDQAEWVLSIVDFAAFVKDSAAPEVTVIALDGTR